MSIQPRKPNMGKRTAVACSTAGSALWSRTFLSSAESEGGCEIARWRPAGGDHRVLALDQSRQLFQPKAPREEARDRAGVIDCVIDFAAARIGSDDDRGNTRDRKSTRLNSSH